MSQLEFATMIGCTPQVISNIERGYTSTKPEVLDKIAGLFSVPVDYLIDQLRAESADNAES